MPGTYVNFSLTIGQDSNITMGLINPINITSWFMQFNLYNRAGGKPLLTKYLSSGFNGASGMTLGSDQESVNIQFNQVDTSGLIPKNYYYTVRRDSASGYLGSGGTETPLTQGYITLLPGG